MTVNNNLLERVRKLLAQAEDPAATPAESETFNAKAAELIARYGIETAMLANAGATRDEITQRSVTVYNPYRRDKGNLLACIAEPLRCRTVHYFGRNARPRVEVFGYTSDLDRIEILFTSLLMQATTQLTRIRPDGFYGHESTTAYRRSWFAGFSNAVHRRLIDAEQGAARDHTTDHPDTSTALVLADRTTQVDQAFNRTYPRLRTMPARRLSGSGRSDGYTAGTHADLGTTRIGQRRTALER